MGFTKLFSDIVMSTIWDEDKATKIVWITMLAVMDAQGNVSASVPGLANAARVTVDECRQALEKLKAPDPDSRSKEYEGRRIKEIEGGWLVLNAEKYRNKNPSRAEYFRQYRERLAATVAQQQHNNAQQQITQAEAEAEAKKRNIKEKKFIPPNLEEVKKYADSINFSLDCQKFIDHYQAVGWKIGKAPMKDWQAAVRTWRQKDTIPPAAPKKEKLCSCGCGKPVTMSMKFQGFATSECRKKMLGW